MPSQLLKEKEEEIARINAELQERAKKIQEDQDRARERQVSCSVQMDFNLLLSLVALLCFMMRVVASLVDFGFSPRTAS